MPKAIVRSETKNAITEMPSISRKQDVPGSEYSLEKMLLKQKDE